MMNDHDEAEIDTLCTELTQAFSTIVSNSAESNAEISAVLSIAERDIDVCKQAAESMLSMSEAMKEEYLPAIRTNEKELERLFSVLDTMEDVVVPALLEDLGTIEGAISTLEKRLAKKTASTSVVSSFLNFLSSSTPSSFSSMGFGGGTSSSSSNSNKQRSTSSSGSSNSSNNSSSNNSNVGDSSDIPCRLHDPKELLAAIGSGIADYSQIQPTGGGTGNPTMTQEKPSSITPSSTTTTIIPMNNTENPDQGIDWSR